MTRESLQVANREIEDARILHMWQGGKTMSHEPFQVMSARVAMGASLKRFCIFATLPRPTALGAELPRLPINATIYEKSFNENGNADVRLCTENRGRAESQNLSQNGYG